MRKPTHWARLSVLLVSMVAALMVGEGVYRWMIFGNADWCKPLRDPGQYADFFSDDDYWKLYHRFGGRYKPPGRPHPTLGWVHRFDRETFLHDRADAIGEHRPVLLYGDSFATCVDTERCFEELLEEDSTFSSGHRLLNYGVGGYGLDQIMMLYERSIGLYDNPLVVVMVMPFDLDRSVLSVRVGQKPFFTLEGGSLQLKGVPVDPDPSAYLANNPPQIRSFVYRKLLFSRYTPAALRSWIRNEEATIAHKKLLGIAMIKRIISDLRRRDLEFLFVVFHPHWPTVSPLDDETDWRDPFLRSLLEDEQVPYIWSKALFQAEMAGETPDFTDWIIPENGHPTTRFNRLVADAIQSHLIRGKSDQ